MTVPSTVPRSAWRLAGLPTAAFAALAVLALGACSLHRVTDSPEVPVAVPDRYASQGEGDPEGQVEPPDRWWEAFEEQELNALVDTILAGNLDLRRGFARLSQAEAIARGAEAGYWPTITADAGVSRQRQVFNLGEPLGFIANTTSTIGLGVGARYEVDLWGRVASMSRASDRDVEATRQDLETVAMTLSARATELWLAIVGERATLALLDAQEEVSRRFVELVELRFGQGMASALEVYQQRQQHLALEGQRPLVEARLEILSHQLAVLAGRAPGQLEPPAAAALPALPATPRTGLPAELLGRRPDVRAAQLRVVAADHRVGAAIADQYPQLSLSGRVGFQARDVASFLDSWIWNLAANLLAPLFDGGRRQAEVERARAHVEDLLGGYAQVVLQAILEVEEALVTERRQGEHLAKVAEQLVFARASLDEATARYVNGLSTYLNVLTALRAVQQAEQTHLATERQVLAARIQLYRALGGAWTAELAPRAAAVEGGSQHIEPHDGGPR